MQKKTLVWQIGWQFDVEIKDSDADASNVKC